MIGWCRKRRQARLEEATNEATWAVLRHFMSSWLMGLAHGDAAAQRLVEFWLERLARDPEAATIAWWVTVQQGRA